ncbi:MAG: phenylalanine--tRNA ligase subunit beta, partial [Candidatus Limnocylindrales bacterium]
IREGVEHPGRTATVFVETEAGHRMELGHVGELDPRYLAANDVRSERVAHVLIDLDGLDRLAPNRRVGTLERLPGAERDIAVVVDRTRGAGEVIDVIHAAGPASLRSVRLFDRYQGPPLTDRQMSLAFRLRFEPGERPLEESELDAAVQDITAALAERLGARLRA